MYEYWLKDFNRPSKRAERNGGKVKRFVVRIVDFAFSLKYPLDTEDELIGKMELTLIVDKRFTTHSQSYPETFTIRQLLLVCLELDKLWRRRRCVIIMRWNLMLYIILYNA